MAHAGDDPVHDLRATTRDRERRYCTFVTTERCEERVEVSELEHELRVQELGHRCTINMIECEGASFEQQRAAVLLRGARRAQYGLLDKESAGRAGSHDLHCVRRR